MRAQTVAEAINRLTAQRGEKKGLYYCATFSCKEVLDLMDSKITKGNLRYVAYVVTKGYTESLIGEGTEQEGRILNMKIRTK